MERGEDQVACFGGHKRHRDGLGVPHLSDEYDVGVFAEHLAQSVQEGLDVPSDLALGDDGLLLGQQVLDGVLDGYDPAGAFFGDPVDK